MFIEEYIQSVSPYFYNIYKEHLSTNKKIDVILFGTGEKSELFLKDYDNVNVKFYCTSSIDKSDEFKDTIPIISIEELQLHRYDLPIIITSKWSDDISKQLKSIGIKHMYHRFSLEYLMHLKELQMVYDILKDETSKIVFLGLVRYIFDQDPTIFETITFDEKQYFLKDIFNFNDNEIIIDGGAFIGDTLENYINDSKGVFNKYYCFEPDNSNFDKLEENTRNLAQRNKVVLYKYGLFSNEQAIPFSSLSSSASCINPLSDNYINAINIDKICVSDEISMIKMDIEGAEYEAVIGSKNTILRTKPKLAICVYHLASDLWKIPLLIKSFDKSYKFYLRHHNKNCWYETVVYATL